MKKLQKRKSTSRVNAMEKANQAHRAFNNKITLEDWLRHVATQSVVGSVTFDFEIENDLVIVRFKAHPYLGDDTCSPVDVYEGYCMRFNIEPKAAIDNMMKFLREKPLRERIVTAPKAVLLKAIKSKRLKK